MEKEGAEFKRTTGPTRSNTTNELSLHETERNCINLDEIDWRTKIEWFG